MHVVAVLDRLSASFFYSNDGGVAFDVRTTGCFTRSTAFEFFDVTSQLDVGKSSAASACLVTVAGELFA
jgi:hypothetical protein